MPCHPMRWHHSHSNLSTAGRVYSWLEPTETLVPTLSYLEQSTLLPASRHLMGMASVTTPRVTIRHAHLAVPWGTSWPDIANSELCIDEDTTSLEPFVLPPLARCNDRPDQHGSVSSQLLPTILFFFFGLRWPWIEEQLIPCSSEAQKTELGRLKKVSTSSRLVWVLGYLVSSRSVWATTWGHISNTKTKKEQH